MDEPSPAARPPSRPGRLTVRSEFLAAAKGRRFHSGLMTLQALARPDRAEGRRFGLTVTKKVGHATERNRIRRRLRAALRALPPDGTAVDVVVVGRRDLLSAPFGRIVAELERGLVSTARPPRATDRAPSVAPGAD